MPPLEPSEDPLLRLVVEIKQIVDVGAASIAVRGSSAPSIPQQLDVRKRSVLSEIREAVTILTMAQEVIAVLRDVIDVGMHELYAQLPEGPIDQSTDAGKRFNELFGLQITLMPRLSFLIKALYEWIYHLGELLDAPPLQQLLPGQMRSRLRAYCAFRDKLVAHQQYAVVDLMRGAMRFSGDFNSIELMLTSAAQPATATTELEALFTACGDKLTDTEREEGNFVERCKILANALDRFRDARRGRISSFIERYGAVSDTPIGIARFLRDLAQAVVPKLA